MQKIEYSIDVITDVDGLMEREVMFSLKTVKDALHTKTKPTIKADVYISSVVDPSGNVVIRYDFANMKSI